MEFDSSRRKFLQAGLVICRLRQDLLPLTILMPLALSLPE